MQKVAIIILSDPKSVSSNEALGRAFNALVLANDLASRNVDFLLFFQGAGTCWVKELADPSHPAHQLFMAVKSKITGASSACANVFGATEGVKEQGIDLLCQFNIPGLGDATSLAQYLEQGYRLITF